VGNEQTPYPVADWVMTADQRHGDVLLRFLYHTAPMQDRGEATPTPTLTLTCEKAAQLASDILEVLGRR
jgi:hypothetical protein